MRRSVSLTLSYLGMAAVFSAATLLLSYRSFEKAPAAVMTVAKKSDAPYTIILDAGHGGEDGGAEANGVREKDINLAVVKDMQAFLLLSDIDVRLTRDDDRLLYDASKRGNRKKQDIDNRISFANGYENAVFVSIHQNKFEIAKYCGLQVYYSPNDARSELLAERLQCAAKEYLEPGNARQIKPAGRNIRVLKELNMPAVLVECGFLSNPSDAAKLSDETYRKRLAFVLSMTLLDTLGTGEGGMQYEIENRICLHGMRRRIVKMVRQVPVVRRMEYARRAGGSAADRIGRV